LPKIPALPCCTLLQQKQAGTAEPARKKNTLAAVRTQPRLADTNTRPTLKTQNRKTKVCDTTTTNNNINHTIILPRKE